MRPADLIHCPIRPTHVNSYLIKTIEVDLRHINYGLSRTKGYGKKARSHFKIEDIVSFFESLNFLEKNSESDGDWEYFVIDKVFSTAEKISHCFLR